jgi:hypothetical protein
MNSKQRQALWRIALTVRRQAVRACRTQGPTMLPAVVWRECVRLVALADTARQRGWLVAHERVLGRLARALGDCRRQLEETEDSLGEVRRRPATTREIFDDLVALDDEFFEVSFDAAAKEVLVVTEPVALDGFDLGRFAIVLNWSQTSCRSGAYRIESFDGRSSGVDEDVGHPHVRDGSLCEGDARPAILAALASGRIFDFFAVVARTLATYNAHNAFLTVDRWHGAACADCGSFVDDDDRTSCERCESELCDACALACQDCGRSLCSGCLPACPVCQEGYCNDCLKPCRRCSRRLCSGCLHEELCQNCRDAQDDDRRPPPRQGGPAAPATEAHAVCMGQIDLSARRRSH